MKPLSTLDPTVSIPKIPPSVDTPPDETALSALDRPASVLDLMPSVDTPAYTPAHTSTLA